MAGGRPVSEHPGSGAGNPAHASAGSTRRVPNCSETTTWGATLAAEANVGAILAEKVTKPCRPVPNPQPSRGC